MRRYSRINKRESCSSRKVKQCDAVVEADWLKEERTRIMVAERVVAGHATLVMRLPYVSLHS